MLATVLTECPLCDQEMDDTGIGWRCGLCDVDFA